MTFWPGFRFGAAGKISQFDERIVERPAGADDADVVRRIFDERGDAAIRVAEQNHLRTREADGRNAPDQTVGGQHRQVFADPVAAAEVNLQVRHQLAGSRMTTLASLSFHGDLPLPAEQRAKLVVFARGGGGLQRLKAAVAGFRGGDCRFLEQFAAGHDGVGGGAGQLLRGVREAEQRQKQTADGEFEAAGRALAAG